MPVQVRDVRLAESGVLHVEIGGGLGVAGKKSTSSEAKKSTVDDVHTVSVQVSQVEVQSEAQAEVGSKAQAQVQAHVDVENPEVWNPEVATVVEEPAKDGHTAAAKDADARTYAADEEVRHRGPGSAEAMVGTTALTPCGPGTVRTQPSGCFNGCRAPNTKEKTRKLGIKLQTRKARKAARVR